MPVQFDLVWSTRYFPVYLVCKPCLVLPWCLIKYYHLSLILVCVFLFLPRVCTMTENQTQTVSGAHSPRFVFHFQKSFVLFLFCLFRGKEVTARHPAIAHWMSVWEFGGIAAIAASPLAASPHARRSREISAAGGGSPKPASRLPSSRVAAPPGAPFAGDHAIGPPLIQCLPARRWLNARRIAADSSQPDRR